MQSGDFVHGITKIHAQYGSVVRTALNKPSFTSSAACRDIYAIRPGQPRFPTNAALVGKPIPRGSSIFDANNEDHARLRRVRDRAFTERAGKFIARLRSQQEQGKDAKVNLVQWFDYLFFDRQATWSSGSPLTDWKNGFFILGFPLFSVNSSS